MVLYYSLLETKFQGSTHWCFSETAMTGGVPYNF